MVAAVSSIDTTPNPKVSSRAPAPARLKRAPLLPSKSGNNGPSLSRSKSTELTSRYSSSGSSSPPNTVTTMSSPSSSCSSSTTTTLSPNSVCPPRRRIPSPIVSRTNSVTPVSAVSKKRDQSTERRHTGYLRTGVTSASAKMVTKTSARSLSVSFQGESFALPVSKAAKPVHNGLRNPTPERRKAVATPAKTSDVSQPIETKLSGSGTATGTTGADRALRKFITTETKLKRNTEIPEIDETVNKLVYDSDNSDHAFSDTESISSGSTLGNVRGGGRRAVVVPARFWQETINLLRRVQPESVSSPLSNSNKLISGYKILNDGPKLSRRGSPFFPAGGAIPLPASPSKGKPKPKPKPKPNPNPSSMRNGVGSNSNLLNTPSILNFSADARRGKVGENKLVDAHALRLFHNNHLQWRFANAKVEAAKVVQQATAQKSLYNAWVTISKMWHSVISKRLQIQQLNQDLKLHSILKKQMPYLDEWDQNEKDHSISLGGAIKVLESSSLCLPVLCGAKADVENLKEAIFSAIDVMQAISVSICSLVTKVENVKFLAFELQKATKSECFLLDQCKDLFSTSTLFEVQECSLRAHALQLVRLGTMTRL